MFTVAKYGTKMNLTVAVSLFPCSEHTTTAQLTRERVLYLLGRLVRFQQDQHSVFGGNVRHQQRH